MSTSPIDYGTVLSLSAGQLSTAYAFGSWFRPYDIEALALAIVIVRTTAAFTSVEICLQVSYDTTNPLNLSPTTAGGVSLNSIDGTQINVINFSTATGAAGTFRNAAGTSNVILFPRFRVGARLVGATPGSTSDSVTVSAVGG